MLFLPYNSLYLFGFWMGAYRQIPYKLVKSRIVEQDTQELL